MPQPDYIRQMLHGHLLNTDYYQLLSEADKNSRITTQTDELLNLLSHHRDELPQPHQDYFDRSIKLLDSQDKRIPQIYGCPKVHKRDYIDNPLNRPILTCVATLPQVYSTYIDYWMKKIVQTLLPSYVKNADTLIDELKKHFTRKLPPGARLFSIDAISMYSNIDSVHGLQVIHNFFEHFKDKLPKHFPTEFIERSLEIIMKQNIFQFGDTFWLQLMGCAMGTSAAVNYSYAYVGLLELQTLLVDYQEFLLFYKRFIDDGLGVWNVSLPNSENKFKEFMAALNNWGKLKWTCTGFVTSLEFLDLTISIQDKEIHFKTFQKLLNLYLYIPPISAHSPDMIRGLIFGRLCCFHKHNTNIKDYYMMAKLLAQRLIARGWNWSFIRPIFSEAHNRITKDHPSNPRTIIQPTMQPLIIHSTYHPRGLQRQDIRKIFNETLGEVIENPTIIAQSRPYNLGNRLCRSKLLLLPGCNPSDFLP